MEIPEISPQQREASWKQWAMEQAVILLAGRTTDWGQLEATAQRIYLWTAFPQKPKEKTDASS